MEHIKLSKSEIKSHDKTLRLKLTYNIIILR